MDLAETARAAEFFGASGIIVTGPATGCAASPGDVAAAKRSVSIPVLAGSGTTPDNLAEVAHHADGMIVGSWLKREGAWFNPPDQRRVREMAAAFRTLRKTS